MSKNKPYDIKISYNSTQDSGSCDPQYSSDFTINGVDFTITFADGNVVTGTFPITDYSGDISSKANDSEVLHKNGDPTTFKLGDDTPKPLSDLATSAQGAKADSAIQQADMEAYITSLNIPIGTDVQAVADDLLAHLQDFNNPHQVTKAQVGLSNVDNTSDANKPVSTAQQTSITNAKNAAINHANAGLAGKVDKVTGSRLITQSEADKITLFDEKHYKSPVQSLVELKGLLEANLDDKERRYVESEGRDYFYDLEATSGDEVPDDQTGGTGFWKASGTGLGYTAEDTANKVQNLNTPNTSTYLSTIGISNVLANYLQSGANLSLLTNDVGFISETLIDTKDSNILLQANDYADSINQGRKWKDPVDVATTGNIVLSGEQVIDGYTTNLSRVLVKDQADATKNGFYNSNLGSWTRTEDADIGTELVAATTKVLNGSININKLYTCSNDTVNLGTTSITFTSGGSATDHNSTTNKQGGTINEYFHLSESNYLNVINLPSYTTIETKTGAQTKSNTAETNAKNYSDQTFEPLLGFLPVDSANKVINFSLINDTVFPTTQAVDTYVSSKIEDQIVDGVTTKAPSQNTVFDALSLKVDKVTGKGLSTEDYTTAEKNKLAGLEGSKFKGTYLTLNALETAYPAPEEGSYAYVDAGAGNNAIEYIWDAEDGWISGGTSGSTETAATIKTKYESNADTNAYTDSEKAKVANVPADTNAELASKASAREIKIISNSTQYTYVAEDFTAKKLIFEPKDGGGVPLVGASITVILNSAITDLEGEVHQVCVNGTILNFTGGTGVTVNAPEDRLPETYGDGAVSGISLVASGVYQIYGDLKSSISGGATTEIDPTVPQHVKDITTTDISNWNGAAGSGASVPEWTATPYTAGNIVSYKGTLWRAKVNTTAGDTPSAGDNWEVATDNVSGGITDLTFTETNVFYTWKNYILEYLDDVSEDFRFSKDSGKTWTNFTNPYGQINYVHIFSDGTVLLCSNTRAFTTKDFVTVTESTILDADGSPFTSTSTVPHFFTITTMYNQIVKIDGVEVLAWGDYMIRPATGADGYGPRMWYTADKGQTLKCTISLVNGTYKARHTHCMLYNRHKNVFITTTGDEGSDCKVIESKYVPSTDTWTHQVKISGADYKFGAIKFDENYTYFITDYTLTTPDRGIIKCNSDKLDDPAAYEYVFRNTGVMKPLIDLYEDSNGNKILLGDDSATSVFYYAKNSFNFTAVTHNIPRALIRMSTINYNGDMYAMKLADGYAGFSTTKQKYVNLTEGFRNAGVYDFNQERFILGENKSYENETTKNSNLTGTSIVLHPEGNNYNYTSPSTLETYTLDLSVPPRVNDFARCFINTANEPVVEEIADTAEVARLQIKDGATTSDNVTINLDGVATNVAVDAGTAEASSIQITAAPTSAENITVTLNGVATNIAVDPTVETTAIAVADKIRNTAFTGWSIAGTAGTDTVTFTSNNVGAKTDTTYSAGTTGATGTATTTTQGDDADTPSTIATKIRGTAFTGWTTAGTDTIITFTATTVGNKVDATYSAGTTGANGLMTTPTQGATVVYASKISGGVTWTANTVMEMIIECPSAGVYEYYFLTR